ncbi:hypothetical protein AXK12_01150 [Cephaloticoccus capnophilus]|uniref:Uroporphyrinogen-III synthase n=1 Tax=Cephaloticoccus capnophilus TaxID=1548208 RepID=A0A139STL4_9BACT|nr:uroporphyrinogen-III synthase [Cephaloticoccus capnophilus]KXU37800.1 hypothetical protein AXK12_01150 [Cephaloticoccus capnophilus]
MSSSSRSTPHRNTKAKPLAGRRIAITRAREQAGELSAKLAALGAEVLELPLIKISQSIDKQELADVLLEFGSYDWIVFTSANGVRYFFQEFFRIFDDIRSLGLLRFAAIGAGTAREIEALRLKVECKPKRATGGALAEALIETGSLDNAKVLVITGNLNRDELVQKLEAARAIVDRLQVYKTEQVQLASDEVAHGSAAAGTDSAIADFRARGADCVLFASSSAVTSYADQAASLRLADGAKPPLFGSIGELTTQTLLQRGLPLAFEAREPSLDSLVDALTEKLGN